MRRFLLREWETKWFREKIEFRWIFVTFPFAKAGYKIHAAIRVINESSTEYIWAREYIITIINYYIGRKNSNYTWSTFIQISFSLFFFYTWRSFISSDERPNEKERHRTIASRLMDHEDQRGKNALSIHTNETREGREEKGNKRG